MPIEQTEVRIGSFYATNGDQLRKVKDIRQFADGSVRVDYLAKSIKKKNIPFYMAATLKNPAKIETFAKACKRKLSNNEVTLLRTSGIILNNE